MAYDAENGQLVMFGGGGSNVNWGSSNFFIWNGSEWEPSSLSIIGHDPAFPLFVWDSRRARPVAFGGTTNWPFSDFSPVTFEWHSGFCTYRDFTPEDTTPPNQRKGQLAAYPDRKVLTLFLPANDSSDRTWEWSLSGWSRPEPDTSPPKHNDSSLVYDGNEGGRILLFGGHNWVASEYDDLWAWDGEDWEELSPLGSTPPACFGAAMAWDSNRNRVVMSCGGDLITSNDFVLSGGGTWEFDGSSWNQSDLTGPGGDPEGDGNPADRVFGTMVHDQSNGVTMLLNGLYPGDETEQWHDHWEFDGTSWARQESLLWPDADLLPANYAASPYFSEKGISWKGWYDPYAKDVVVMGQDGNSHYIEPYVEPLEAWRWDGETWHHLPDPADPEGDGEPAPRMGYYMDFFAPAGLPLLFGGRIDQSVWTDDTWYWNRGLGQRPGHVLRVNLIESGVEDASSYTGLEMTWHAGGTGTMDEEEIHGTRLSIWHAGTFMEKVSNEAPAEAPESLVWSTDDPLVLTGLPVGANLVVGAAVTPAGANWYEYATLSSSYAEVKLSYH
jgi:hypothetical protein